MTLVIELALNIMKRSTTIILVVSIYVAIVGALILFFVFRVLLPSRGVPSADPAETIMSFVDAYNDDDIEKMLDYLTPDKQKTVRGFLDAADEYSSGQVRKAIQMMPIVSRFAGYAGRNDTLPDLEVTVKKVKKSQKDAQAEIVVSAEAINLVSVGFKVDLDYNTEDGVWLIDSAEPSI